MNESIFQIESPGVDTARIVQDIQAKVSKKLEEGVYDDARIARAERSNLIHLRKEEAFLSFYLRCLRDAVYIDISDFEIRERRALLSPLLIMLKKTIWSLLKFYTYRLWSQQNQVNGLMVTAIEGLDEKYSDKIELLEKRLKEMEQKNSTS